MLISLSFIFLIGLVMSVICSILKLPKIVGMLAGGIILGPFVLNILDSSILLISGDLRKIALIIILIKAGLSLNLSDLKKVGRPALLLSFLPASIEIIGYILFAPIILGVSTIEAALMGTVLAAVSPAVVVPGMVQLMENKYGINKSIPQMIMAGASCDDIFVIVLFTTFLGMAQGGNAAIIDFFNIPISIVLGILLGGGFAYILAILFEIAYKCKRYIKNSIKVIIILACSFLLITIEIYFQDIISISSLLAIVSMACILKLKTVSSVSKRLSEKFGKLWLAAEIILFVLVGAAVDIRYTMKAGLSAVLLILISLFFRAIGVLLSTAKTNLNIKERLFCVISYIPKATVQAAIGSVPLVIGLECGPIILSVAVMSILITAPLGALGIDLVYDKLLVKDNNIYKEQLPKN